MVSVVKTVVLPDGEVVSFSRFTLEDLDILAERYKAEYKAVSVKNAVEDKWDSDAIWNLKSSIDLKTVDIKLLYAAARSPRWMNIFLRYSLDKVKISNDKQTEILSQLGMDDRIDICEKLILDVPEVSKHEKPSNDKEGVDPLSKPEKPAKKK